MGKYVNSPWIKLGIVLIVFLALLIALYFEKDTIVHILGVIFAVVAWFAIASFFPDKISNYSTLQKIILILTIITVMTIGYIMVLTYQ